jgi:hypothetical protein
VSGVRVDLSWTPSTDNVGVQGYDVFRNGGIVGTVTSPSFSDLDVSPGSTYSYSVQARDGVGNASTTCSAVSVTVPTASTTFSDGFESGSMSAWTTVKRMSVESGSAYDASFSVRSRTTGGDPSYAVKVLPTVASEVYARTFFSISNQQSTMNLIRLQSAGGANIFTVFVNQAGDLMFRNDTRSIVAWSSTRVSRNAWHQVQVRARVGASGQTEVWYDGQRIAALSLTQNLGTAGVGRLVLGDNVKGRTFNVLFDEVAVGPGPIA